jgi:hypothetical protein
MDQIRIKGGVLLGALIAGGLATASLGSAPTAHATCASFFGIGNSADCTSNLTSVAIAIGTKAEAHANGLFGTAIAIGYNSGALIGPKSALNVAIALAAPGAGAGALAGGIVSLAVSVGKDGYAAAGLIPGYTETEIGNIAIDLGNHPATTYVAADGIGNTAVAVGNDTAVVDAFGVLASAANFFGSNTVTSGALVPPDHIVTNIATVAFSAFGSGNTVQAGPGSLALAGSIFQTGATVTKIGPGFNINGVKAGGAAAVGNAKPATPTAAALPTRKKTAAPAASGLGGVKKTTAPAAAGVGRKK